MKNTLVVAVAFSLVFLLSATVSAKTRGEYVPGEIIIKLKGEYAKKLVKTKTFRSLKIKNIMDLSFGKFAVLKTDNKKDILSVIKEFSKHPEVEYAEPNYLYRAIGKKIKALTTDPKYGDLWGLKNNGNNEPRSDRGNSSPRGVAGADINAERAWTITKGSKIIKIAVIDTGIDYNHPDLKANMWTNEAEANGTAGVDDDGNGYIDDIHGYDIANQDGDPMDGNGHGTHCAGTIAAEHGNGIGIAGVMAQAELVGIKFLTDQGSGSSEHAIMAIDYAIAVGVDLMSNSWGGGGASQALEDAIVRANNVGIVFTAAAGNSATNNNNTPHYPSNYQVDNVISVAAHNYNNTLASFSCFGSNTVHVAAPGRNILSTTPNNQYSVFSGTSMATPHVSGVIGLYLAQFGKAKPSEIRDALINSSVYDKSYDRKIISSGRVDAYNFLTGIVTPRPSRPDESDWVTKTVAVFESAHPYLINSVKEKTFSVPGAKYMRVIVDKYDLERSYDFVHVVNSKGAKIDSISGDGFNYKSEYVEGDSIKLIFEADSSVTLWGFIVTQIQYIK